MIWSKGVFFYKSILTSYFFTSPYMLMLHVAPPRLAKLAKELKAFVWIRIEWTSFLLSSSKCLRYAKSGLVRYNSLWIHYISRDSSFYYVFSFSLVNKLLNLFFFISLSGYLILVYIFTSKNESEFMFDNSS